MIGTAEERRSRARPSSRGNRTAVSLIEPLRCLRLCRRLFARPNYWRDDADSPGVESIDPPLSTSNRDFRMGLFSSSYFRRKDIHQLIGQMNDSERLHRRLGPLALMGLGIGATIGSGLYVQTGRIANEYAGPSLIISFLLAAIGCGFAALCYSELASMVPVAGSAYTYAYATLGELLAWIIGWDLILEYAIGSSFVAAGWSNYFTALLRNVFHFQFDPRFTSAPWDFNVERRDILSEVRNLGR